VELEHLCYNITGDLFVMPLIPLIPILTNLLLHSSHFPESFLLVITFFYY